MEKQWPSCSMTSICPSYYCNTFQPAGWFCFFFVLSPLNKRPKLSSLFKVVVFSQYRIPIYTSYVVWIILAGYSKERYKNSYCHFKNLQRQTSQDLLKSWTFLIVPLSSFTHVWYALVCGFRWPVNLASDSLNFCAHIIAIMLFWDDNY